MELIIDLIQNYKQQTKYYYDIEQINGRVHHNKDTAESIIEGLHQSQEIIDKIKILNDEKSHIEKNFIRYYKMERFDLANLPDLISPDLQMELLETIEKLRYVIKSVIDIKSGEKTILEEDLLRAKEKMKETIRGVNAVHGYKKKTYDSVFIDKVSK
ncbi:MAG: hypothetical protein JW702_00400 [Clostridiales bacterium]|nr:hypothetical protein [Clostridiales bacterium]